MGLGGELYACFLNVTEEFPNQSDKYCILVSFSLIFLRRLSLILRYSLIAYSSECKWDRFYIINQFKYNRLAIYILYSSLFKFKRSWLMKTALKHPTKMIHFIEMLYQQFKVLNRITEKESVDFQREVVNLLVDSKQNVNSQTLQEILKEKNIEGFVLDVLSKVINRSPFKNQFELNRNLAAITQNVKKQQQELQRKQKILQRKQQKIKTVQDGLMATLKQKISILENQSLQKLTKKENQIKKSITTLISQLKSKEKLILERYQTIKANQNILTQIEIKEKSLNQKLRIIERKEKEVKAKDNEGQIARKESQINQLKESMQRLRQSLKQSSKRYKNLQMAYKKLKNAKLEQPPPPKHKQQLVKLQLNDGNELDKLQLSQICQVNQNHNYNELINYIDLQEANTKMQEIKRVFVVKDKNSSAKQLKQIKTLLKIENPTQSLSSEEEEKEQSLDREPIMPSCLQFIEQASKNDANSLINRIKAIDLQEDTSKLVFIKQRKLQALIEQSKDLNNPQKVCQVMLQKVLELIEQSSHYLQIIEYLSSKFVTNYLQDVYLSHETNPDIIETTTLILSRIKLKDFELTLNPSFAKALQIRLKVQSKSSFLYGNIHFILN